MGNYTGAKCLVCGEIFNSEDDIVVCPECGTPYHRECYKKEGKCINTELHEKGMSYGDTTETPDGDNDNSPLRCIRCGAENSSDKLFCEQCGTPLMKQGGEERPFNDNLNGNSQNNSQNGNPENMGANGMPFTAFPGKAVLDKNSDIDGVKLGDYATYVKSNYFSFITYFVRFGKFGGKVSLNIGAFLFPEIYFLFRKMKKIGVLALVVCAALSIPGMIELFSSGYGGIKIGFPFDVTSTGFVAVSSACWYVQMIFKVLAGLFANFIYYKQAKRDIVKIREHTEGDEETIKKMISSKGGVSLASLIIGFAVYSMLIVSGVFVANKLL